MLKIVRLFKVFWVFVLVWFGFSFFFKIFIHLLCIQYLPTRVPAGQRGHQILLQMVVSHHMVAGN